jgi:hypothetical protein
MCRLACWVAPTVSGALLAVHFLTRRPLLSFAHRARARCSSEFQLRAGQRGV